VVAAEDGGRLRALPRLQESCTSRERAGLGVVSDAEVEEERRHAGARVDSVRGRPARLEPGDADRRARHQDRGRAHHSEDAGARAHRNPG
jgi:hypothetical protein